MDPESGGEPRVLGGKGIGYQKRLPGEIEVDGWNTVEVIARGDSTVHILNGQVVNQGKKIRLVDPKDPTQDDARDPRPDRAGDRGGGDLVPERRDPDAGRGKRSEKKWALVA